jgi:hypothetical protein
MKFTDMKFTNSKILVKTNCPYDMADIFAYLGGDTEKLEGKISVRMEYGSKDGYDTCIVT